MKPSHVALACCLALLSLPAAARPPSSRLVDAAKIEQFRDQAAAIRDAMQPGGRFDYLDAAERQAVEAQLAAIDAVLQRRRDAKLDDDDQLDIYEAQESANAILMRQHGRRLVCEISAPTGSNRRVKQCATQAERARAHKESRDYLRETLGKSPSASESLDSLGR